MEGQLAKQEETNVVGIAEEAQRLADTAEGFVHKARDAAVFSKEEMEKAFQALNKAQIKLIEAYSEIEKSCLPVFMTLKK